MTITYTEGHCNHCDDGVTVEIHPYGMVCERCENGDVQLPEEAYTAEVEEALRILRANEYETEAEEDGDRQYDEWRDRQLMRDDEDRYGLWEDEL